MFKFEWVFSATLICLLILDGHDVLCSHATHVVLCYRKWWDSLAACHGFTWVRKIFCSLSQWSLCLLCPRSSFFFKLNEWINLISLSVALYKQLVPGSCCISKRQNLIHTFPSGIFHNLCLTWNETHLHQRGLQWLPRRHFFLRIGWSQCYNVRKGTDILVCFYFLLVLVGNVFSQQIRHANYWELFVLRRLN